jgi:hypothetical protein
LATKLRLIDTLICLKKLFQITLTKMPAAFALAAALTKDKTQPD